MGFLGKVEELDIEGETPVELELDQVEPLTDA